MSKRAILCVDDEAIIVLALKQELRMNLGDQYKYETAMDAQEAMEIIDELVLEGVEVILILSDWLMPGIKGDEFLVQVKGKYPKINSIMITGQADQQAVDRVIKEAGTHTVIRKPWNSSELMQAVRHCCSI